MGNPKHRPKHLQSRSWFSLNVKNKKIIVRPVDGKDWFNQPGISCGVIHLVNEYSELVCVVDIGDFNKNAIKISDIYD